MLKFYSLVSLLWLSISALAHSSSAVGFKEIDLDKGELRPLSVAIWYPVKNQTKTINIGDNQTFYGINVVQNGVPGSDEYPLVVLSHGYGGSWRNLSWLANELTGQGYIVAAPDHPGTSVFNKDMEQATKLWERPHDLSRVIDAITTDSKLGGKVDMERIAAIGHSLGGWTVIALSGGRFDTGLFKKDCQKYSTLWACNPVLVLGLEKPELERNMEDSRIKAFISLDAGLIRGFSSESLAKIHIPSLIIGAGTDVGDMPVELESGYLNKYLSKTYSTYVEIPDAMHFSFMQVCKSGAIGLLEGENKGDGIICKDGGSRNRNEIHREIAFLVTGFLAKKIPNVSH
ncbi:alpha/beta hydrolase family protein [Xenorhabdus bovienii]|uniref:Putative dienelactone hydrolase n=2 Tax=Xenorhabdus bovienii TaxID=40576 RepID=A0A077PW02_XENBV|nr:alpha/beta fold hydrolase [Xenorhabdus bovienii]CDH25283.1 putative dienelactone hydrolase [Xenorhabdus bovienii str. kraussei Becker Underwood]